MANVSLPSLATSTVEAALDDGASSVATQGGRAEIDHQGSELQAGVGRPLAEFIAEEIVRIPEPTVVSVTVTCTEPGRLKSFNRKISPALPPRSTVSGR